MDRLNDTAISPDIGTDVENTMSTGAMQTSIRSADTPFKGMRTNLVQSIRAFHAHELQELAAQLDQHFLYVNLGEAQTKQDVLETVAHDFLFPAHFGKNFDALYDCLTDPLHKAGPQPGFVVVLEAIPTTAKFDKEAREQLLDVFREAAEYWNDRKIAFRCFYSFAVARATHADTGAEQTNGHAVETANGGEACEKMPTDKLVDVSPLALRMSSPFNAGYWLSAA